MWCSYAILVLSNSGVKVGWEVIIAGICIQGHSSGGKNSLLIQLVHPVVVLLYVV